MAQWIADHLVDTVRRFVNRSAAGQRAGVWPAIRWTFV